jgi:hypothetical protein
MNTHQYLLFAGFAALLLGSWLCAFMFFRRFRDHHRDRWVAAGQPDISITAQPNSDALPFLVKSRWKKHADETGDLVLQRLFFWWRTLEWLFALGVVVSVVWDLT